MLQVERKLSRSERAIDSLTLSYDERKKSRLRTCTDSGRDVAIVLPRGSTLHEGDLLQAKTGEVLVVRAKQERVSEAWTRDAHLLARAAYHLGNRHVPLQIGAGLVRYQHDHVLDAMVRALGLEVREALSAFQPEPGAYAHGGHGHEHSHEPGTDHAHEHPHRGSS